MADEITNIMPSDNDWGNFNGHRTYLNHNLASDGRPVVLVEGSGAICLPQTLAIRGYDPESFQDIFDYHPLIEIFQLLEELVDRTPAEELTEELLQGAVDQFIQENGLTPLEGFARKYVEVMTEDIDDEDELEDEADPPEEWLLWDVVQQISRLPEDIQEVVMEAAELHVPNSSADSFNDEASSEE